MTYTLHRGDCLEVLRTMADNSVDSIVTDPPYGLKFMGKKWDYDVPSVEVWAECLRVLKPGGYLLAFAGTRTQHRMAVRIEDAGFEIRDMMLDAIASDTHAALFMASLNDEQQRTFSQVIAESSFGGMLAWVYGSGFPKSHNGEWGGTALKPALEPITMARKPLVGTVEKNWREHGVGALNIDGCRVDAEDGGRPLREVAPLRSDVEYQGNALAGRVDGSLASSRAVGSTDLGRWPANLIHDGSEEVLAAFPDAPGQMADASTNADQRKTQNVYGAMRRGRGDEPSAESENEGAVGFKMKPGARRLDAGSAARFFYCAKASRADRNEGLFSSSTPAVGSGATMREREIADWPARNGNFHPTVKPIALMAYLIRLVTPPHGTTLDCYMGSGSTGVAAMREGFNFIGIERDEDENGEPLGYMDISRARIEYELRKPKQNQLDLEAA